MSQIFDEEHLTPFGDTGLGGKDDEVSHSDQPQKRRSHQVIPGHCRRIGIIVIFFLAARRFNREITIESGF